MREDALPCSVMPAPKQSCSFILCQFLVAHQNTDPQVWDGVGSYLISFVKSFFCGMAEEGEIKEPLAVFQESER